MRFSAVHKVASYLMVAAAFAVLALSGELPLPWLVFTVGGAAASYFIEPARQRFFRALWWGRVWNALTLLVFGWTVWEAMRGETLIQCGVRFLCFLLVNKLCNRRASKDYLQAYVVSFLMLVAGTTLNTEIAYALCFVAYVVFATWTLTLFHLRREMEDNYLLKHSDDAQSERVEVERILNSRRVVGPAFLAGTSLVSAGIFLGAAVIFFLFPRVGLGAFSPLSRRGLRVGFNDVSVELGQNGLVKDNGQVVMRVEFPEGRPAAPLYFRGIAFERYNRESGGQHAGWGRGPGSAHRELRRIEQVSIAGYLDHFGVERDKRVRRDLGASLRYDVYLEPMGDTTVIFAASRPVGVKLPPGAPGASAGFAEGDRLDNLFAGERVSGIKYSAFSRLAPPSGQLLDAQPDLAAERYEEFKRTLQVPEDLPPRIIELAQRVTKDAKGPAQKIGAIMRYLRQNYRYTVDLKHDLRLDPLEDFLFQQKAGHCEYFATALAVLLRVVGVPTRHVAGFYGGDWNSYGDYLQVRQRDAHAWVEAWLGDAGWVTFDPTPPSASGEAEGAFGARLREMLDAVQLAWFKYVIEFDLGKQEDMFKNVRGWFEGSGKGDGPGGQGQLLAWASRHRGDFAGGLAALGAGVYVLWRRRRRGAAHEGAIPSRQRRQVASAYERAARALEKRGIRRAAHETPRELAGRATTAGDPGASAFAELVGHYYASRWGGETPDRAKVDALADAVVRPPMRDPYRARAG